MQNRYVLFVFEVRGDSFGVGDFQGDFEGHPLFKNNLIARTRRFIDLFVCVNFERLFASAARCVPAWSYARRHSITYDSYERRSYDSAVRFQSIHCRPSFDGETNVLKDPYDA